MVLAKRLRSEGYTVVQHRPRVRGTDFADQWSARFLAANEVAPKGQRLVRASRPAVTA